MNLIDAVKSGRPFRRKGALAEWYEFYQAGEQAYLKGIGPFPREYQAAVIHLSPEIITGWEWEIQEPAVTITRTQLLNAAGFVREGDRWRYIGDAPNREEALRDLAIIARKLGLEEP